MNTYFFYDLETTGLNKTFDQILQFAAIRTDMAFNEIQRYNIKVKLRPDIIPSPDASITHRISLAESMQGINEFEAISQIYRLINQPNTISIGYNTSKFDDEFLRFSFHRNLLPPYNHQYKNGCRRMDLLPITNIYYLHKREVLNWPEIDGKPSMRLEEISEANQLATGQAHNAMVDVEASVELARRFSSTAPEIWQYLSGYFEKDIDAKRITEMPLSFQSIACTNRIGLMIGNEYGSENNYQIPVLLIGNSIPYPKQSLWLRLDQPDLFDIPAEKTIVIRKKYGEPNIILPAHQRYWDTLSQDRQGIVEENQDWLQSHTQQFHKIIQYHREFTYPYIPDLDIEAALYQRKFLSTQELNLCREFHQTKDLAKRVEILQKFEEIEMRQLASRLLCRNYPNDNLPEMLTKDFEDYMSRVNPKNEDDAYQDHKGNKRTTPLQALTDIKKLKTELALDKQQIELLDELEGYIKSYFGRD